MSNEITSIQLQAQVLVGVGSSWHGVCGVCIDKSSTESIRYNRSTVSHSPAPLSLYDVSSHAFTRYFILRIYRREFNTRGSHNICFVLNNGASVCSRYRTVMSVVLVSPAWYHMHERANPCDQSAISFLELGQSSALYSSLSVASR